MRHSYLITIAVIVCLTAACNRTEDFYNTIKVIPQLYMANEYAYNTAYAVGDTMTVTGLLQPENDLAISVGSAQGEIVRLAKVKLYSGGDTLDQVSIIITSAMGIGAGRPVTINSGGYSVDGPEVEIYETAGTGSLDHPLKLSTYFTPPADAVYFYCVSGNGNIYYYSKKEGTISAIINGAKQTIAGSSNFKLESGATFRIDSLYSGGVDTKEQNLYFSAKTNKGYLLCHFNIASPVLTVMNRNASAAIAPPFEGELDTLHFIANGIYPDTLGNLYMTFVEPGASSFYAVTRYTHQDNQLSYLFKQRVKINNGISLQFVEGMPGLRFQSDEIVSFLRVQPDEKMLYVFSLIPGSLTPSGFMAGRISEYDMETRFRIIFFTSQNNIISHPQYLGPFSMLTITFDFSKKETLSFMPLPNRRLLAILYQQWTAIDFSSERFYAWAPGKLETSGLNLDTQTDVLLNYDQSSNLYMTGNGRKFILKTTRK